MMDQKQLRDLITRTLKDLELHSKSAVELLMGTAAVESNLGTYLRQIQGPALGIFQMEPATELDIWRNYLSYKPALAEHIKTFRTDQEGIKDLEANLVYQIAMARVHYLRVPNTLPHYCDVIGLGLYWKNHYNTHKGKGTVDKFVNRYEDLCI